MVGYILSGFISLASYVAINTLNKQDKISNKKDVKTIKNYGTAIAIISSSIQTIKNLGL
jgi:hypothetical protein